MKMQGAGNDFIVIDNRSLKLDVDVLPALARQVCQYHISLGGDALMVVDTPTQGGDLKMRFYNSDGSEGEMCGNGARCLARYAYEMGIAGAEMTIETMAGNVYAQRQSKRQYKIRLNDPTTLERHRALTVDGTVYDCAYVELGRPGLPHVVLMLPGLREKTLEELRPLAKALRHHPDLPAGANVNFCAVEGESLVRLLTYERGVEDFTLACGTGAGSTALALLARGVLPQQPVTLVVRGGQLRVDMEKETQENWALYLTGDTNCIAQGVLLDEELHR